MTDTRSAHIATLSEAITFTTSLAPRLPRILAVTAVVVFSTFAAIQFIPQTFEARLALSLPAGSQPDIEAARLIDQEKLADVVSRLSPDIVAELRRDGNGILDTTTLLRQRLTLTEDGPGLNLTAKAGTPARAKAIVEAVAASQIASAEIPPALPEAPAAEPVAEAAPVMVPTSNEDIKLLQQRLSLAWEDRVKLENRASRIEGLIADGNYAVLALEAENLPGLGRQMDDLAQLENERERRDLKFLPNHPTMRTLKTEIDQLSSDISVGVQQLASLVTADRDAARRVEDGLRDQLATAMIPETVDTSMATGSIDAAEPTVIALPRPIRTDLTLAFAGGLAFFGQIGFFALLRPRQHPLEEIDADEPALAPTEAYTAPAPVVSADHNWLPTFAPVTVETAWREEPAAAAPVAKAPPRPAPRANIDDVKVVALRSHGDAGAAARKLLAYYERQNRRVVLVDAASRRRGRVLGLTDLAQGRASFADVVHGSGRHEAALVPWGCENELDPSAKPVRILVAALAELYDVVILSIDDENPRATAPLEALADLTIEADAVPGPARRAA